jgi:conjugative relaxase-like TrwC/TraI family protein
MLSVTPSISSERAKRYFGESLKRDDYYTRGQEVAGQWFGKGAEQLGLQGQVDQESYFALCDNLHPQTLEQLTPRQKTNRRPMYDWTFSAPKDISVLYEYSGDERILDAFTQSYRETLREAEAEMKTRVRKGGQDEDRVTGNMVGAEFTHFTARPVEGQIDPHLHAHCVIFNTTFDSVENRWKASQQGDLKRDADYWEAAFHARFAKRLNDLGLATEKDGSSFRLAGLPLSITDKFSLRRNQVETMAAEKGVTSASGKQVLKTNIREPKQKDVAKSTLRQQWDARLTGEEKAALNRVMASGDGGGDGPISPQQAIDYSLDHSFQKASAVSEKRLKAEALRYGVGSVLPEEVAGLTQNDGVIAKDVKGQVMATTQKTLDAEVAMLQFAQDGHGKYTPLGDSSAELPGLSEEQQRAARLILKSRDRVVGVRGGAGTGKTTMMRSTIDAMENGKQKREVFVFAPSAQASRGVLKKDGFEGAETLEMLLRNEKLQQQTRGGVLWVDEAGLVSSVDMKRLFDVAKKGGNRIVLSGDYRQHASVEAGDAFRLLESEAGVRLAELKEIRRQTDPEYKKAIFEISKGTAKGAQKGFDRLDKMGAIVEATGEGRHQMLVNDYLKAVDEGKTALIIAPTHAEGERLTEELRERLKARGVIGKERGFIVRKGTGWTDAQKGDSRNFQPGMVVEFSQNVKGFTKGDKAVVVQGGRDVQLLKRDGTQAVLPEGSAEHFEVYRTHELSVGIKERVRITKNGRLKSDGKALGAKVNNGDILTVESYTREGDIRFENGKILPKDYGHFTTGYVDTSYGSQSKTVDREFVAVGNESRGATNRQQWYVSLSRGREQVKVYVDSKEDVRIAIAKGTERMSAVELTKTRIRENWRVRLKKTLERNRVARFLKDRTDAVADYWRSQKDAQRSMGYGRG